MPMPAQFLSCDWGTSSFRLRLVQGADRKMLAEIREPVGVRSLYEEWLQDKSRLRGELFERFLKQKITQLLDGWSTPASVPLIVSGMASSSIGWIECAYATDDLHLDGRGLKIFPIKWDAPAPVDQTHLVSGLATDCEMMRGEECQILGIMNLPEIDQRFRWKSTLLLPGTHSKHVSIMASAVLGFETYMTGELYEVLCKHTILRATTDISSDIDDDSFKAGLGYASQHGFAASIFQARTRGVLQGHSATQNAAFLSGVLIGGEVQELLRKLSRKEPVIVAAGGQLAALYRRALDLLAPASVERLYLSSEQADLAVVTAHQLIVSRLFNDL